MKESFKGNFDMLIGNHLIKGKAVDLAKPLIMTEKVVDHDSG